jgi:hypothetical protein
MDMILLDEGFHRFEVEALAEKPGTEAPYLQVQLKHIGTGRILYSNLTFVGTQWALHEFLDALGITKEQRMALDFENPSTFVDLLGIELYSKVWHDDQFQGRTRDKLSVMKHINASDVTEIETTDVDEDTGEIFPNEAPVEADIG